MSKQDLYRFNVRFDETDEDHQRVCAFLNTCGRKKARYIVKAFLAYWEKSGGGTSIQLCEKMSEAETEKQSEPVKAEKKPAKGEEHLVNIDESGYSADQAEVSLMIKNYQMFDTIGKER